MKLAQKLVIGFYRTRLKILSAISKRKAAKSAFTLFCTPLRRARGKHAPMFEKAEPLQFEIDGYVIRGYRWKNGSGRRAMIVHGFESSSKNFDRYIEALVNKEYEVVVFDAPAHGESSGKRITLPLYTATIAKVHELYGKVDAYIGHSFGGLVLSHFLEHHEHSGNTKVVFIAPATETITSMKLFFDFLRLDEGVRNEFQRLIVERFGNAPEHYSIRRTMKQVKAQVLWFHDEDDELTPIADALKVRDDAHENIRFSISKGLGHRKIYRDNRIFNEAMNFLD